MTITQTEKNLLSVLHYCGADNDMMIGVTLFLRKSVETMGALIDWILLRNPDQKEMSKEEQSKILLEAVRIHDLLPKELQMPESQTED